MNLFITLFGLLLCGLSCESVKTLESGKRPLKKVVARAGTNLTLPCNALNEQSISKIDKLTWKSSQTIIVKYIDGKPLDHQKRRFLNLKNFSLHLSPVQLNDRGEYTCHVNEKAATDAVDLVVHDVPETPNRPMITSFTSRTVNLSWASIQDPKNEPVVDFILETRIGESGEWDQLPQIHTNNSITSYQMTGLLPFTIYSFRVRAVNSLGISPPSKESYYIVTLREVPAGKPTITTAHNTSSNSIYLSWKPPPHDTIFGEFLGYRITYHARDVKPENINEIFVRDSNVESHEIHELDIYTQYLISIQVFNPEGIGPAANIVVMTDEGALKLISDESLVNYVTSNNVIATSKSRESNDFMDYVTKNFMENPKLVLTLWHNDKLKTNKVPIKSSIILTESYKDWQKFYPYLKPQSFSIHGYYIVTLTNGEIPEIQQIFAGFWKHEIYNVIVVYANPNGSVSVLTYFPYQSSTDCSNTTPRLVNEFVNGSFKRELSGIFPNKMNNLKQCQVRVAARNNNRPYMSYKPNTNGTKQLYGIAYNILLALSSSLNFKINFTYLGSESAAYSNKKIVTGTYKSLLENKADISISNYWLRIHRLKLFDSTVPYAADNVVVVLQFGSELSSFEKLFYPLALDAWIWLIGFIGFGTAIVFIVNRQSRVVRNFVFGWKVKYPYLNLLIGLLGQNQARLPGRNFARFILMNFILFSLVIRTAYLGKMFQMMKLNMKHPVPDSIDQAIKQNYEFIIPLSLNDSIKLSNVKHWIWYQKGSNTFTPDFLWNLDHKSAILEDYIRISNVLNSNKSISLKILNENYLTVPLVMYSRKNCHLLRALDGKLELLQASGLINYWTQQHMDVGPLKDDDLSPQKLALNHLSGCFIIWLGCCLFSSMVFITEMRKVLKAFLRLKLSWAVCKKH